MWPLVVAENVIPTETKSLMVEALTNEGDFHLMKRLIILPKDGMRRKSSEVNEKFS